MEKDGNCYAATRRAEPSIDRCSKDKLFFELFGAASPNNSRLRILIEGVNGLIVVDPGESNPASQIVKDALNAQLDNIFDKKPVKAIIYTHGHDCHIHGAAVFANEQTEIIAQEGLMSGLFMDLVVGLQLTDAGKNKPNPAYYTLDIRKGILEVNPPSASTTQLMIVADTLTWKEVVLSKLTSEDVVANGKVVIAGGTPASFNSFMDLFE